jgi:hypothetical protein
MGKNKAFGVCNWYASLVDEPSTVLEQFWNHLFNWFDFFIQLPLLSLDSWFSWFSE